VMTRLLVSAVKNGTLRLSKINAEGVPCELAESLDLD
jgi:hypothetical protein